jgi:uncharacterized protein
MWLLLALFCCRVLGQVFVVLLAPGWLPPMKEWQSGLLPYPMLLASQIVIIGVFAMICLQVARGNGRFGAASPIWGNRLRWFGMIYFGGMVLRYALTMWLRPERRWFGGTIPIVFHFVLASFFLVYAAYHGRFAVSRNHA